MVVHAPISIPWMGSWDNYISLRDKYTLNLGILHAFLVVPAETHRAGMYHGREREKQEYRSYSNKRRGAY